MCHKKAKFEHPRKSPRRHYIIHNHENMSVQTPIRHTSGKRRQRSLPVALLPTAFHSTSSYNTHLSAEGGYRRSIQLALKLHRCPKR